MKASLAQAERRPDDLKDALEKLGQAPPSNRQLFLLRAMGLIVPPPGASILLRIRGILLLILFVVVLLAVGFGARPAVRAAVRRRRHRRRADAGRPDRAGRARRARAARPPPPGEGQGHAGRSAAADAHSQFIAAASRRRCSRASGWSTPSSVKIPTITRRSRSRRSPSARLSTASERRSESGARSRRASQASNAVCELVAVRAQPERGRPARPRRSRRRPARASPGPSSMSPRRSSRRPRARLRVARGAGPARAPGAAGPRPLRGSAGGQLVRLGRAPARRRTAPPRRAGRAPVNSVVDLAVAEGLHGGDALDPEAGREALVGVDVDLGELDLARARVGGAAPAPA